MSASLERRLTIISAVVIGGGFVAIVIAFTLFAFSTYVSTLNRDVLDTIVDVQSVLQNAGGPPSDARLAARRLSAHFFSEQMRISLLDQHRRVEIYRRSATMPYVFSTSGRNDAVREYPIDSFPARSALALADALRLGPATHHRRPVARRRSRSGNRTRARRRAVAANVVRCARVRGDARYPARVACWCCKPCARSTT